MKSVSFITVLALAAGIAAQSAPAATTTITASAGCPSAAPADVMVTRSNVPVPSCEAGNATKPSIVSMSSGGGAGGASATGTGQPAQFTGAAAGIVVPGVLAVVAGVVGWAL